MRRERHYGANVADKRVWASFCQLNLANLQKAYCQASHASLISLPLSLPCFLFMVKWTSKQWQRNMHWVTYSKKHTVLSSNWNNSTLILGFFHIFVGKAPICSLWVYQFMQFCQGESSAGHCHASSWEIRMNRASQGKLTHLQCFKCLFLCWERIYFFWLRGILCRINDSCRCF